MSGDARRFENQGTRILRVPEADNSWRENLGSDSYFVSMASMASETKDGGGQWKVGLNNDKSFAGLARNGKLVAVVADGADGVGRWGGVLADKLISATYERGLSVESLRAAASVVSGILLRENVTIENVASTFTGVEIEEGGNFRLLHLGDSRAWVLRAVDRAVITKITKDRDELHDAARKIGARSGISWRDAEEEAARMGKRANVLTSAVMTSADGGAEVEKTQVILDDLKAGDLLILCSDGLEKYLPEGEIWRIAKDHMERGGGSGSLAAKLVKEAYARAVQKKGEMRRIDAITVVTVSR